MRLPAAPFWLQSPLSLLRLGQNMLTLLLHAWFQSAASSLADVIRASANTAPAQAASMHGVLRCLRDNHCCCFWAAHAAPPRVPLAAKMRLKLAAMPQVSRGPGQQRARTRCNGKRSP